MLVNREEFIKLLTRLKPALSSGGSIVELRHVWFDGDAALAFDGGFGLRIDYESPLNCGVPGAALIGLLGTSPLKEASLDAQANSVQVKLGKSTSKLASLEGDRKIWPFPAKLPKAHLKLGEEFIEGLRKTLFIKARPALRVEHHGVMLQRNKQDLELYATDTATMARVVIPGAAKEADFERTLLPYAFAEQLVAQAPEGVKLYALEDCLVAEAEGISFYSNLLDISSADDMGAVVTKHTAKHPKAVPLPPGFSGALARAEVLAGAEEPIVEVRVEGTKLKLFGDYALGTLNEELPLEGKLPEAKLRLPAKQLRQALVHAEGFSLTKDVFLLEGEPEFTYLAAALK